MLNAEQRNLVTQRYQAKRKLALVSARMAGNLDLSSGMFRDEVLRSLELTYQVKALLYEVAMKRPADAAALRRTLTAELGKSGTTLPYREKIGNLLAEIAA